MCENIDRKMMIFQTQSRTRKEWVQIQCWRCLARGYKPAKAICRRQAKKSHRKGKNVIYFEHVGGISKDPHARCWRIDMCFLDRFDWLCKAFTRASCNALRPGTKLSRSSQSSIFILLDPCIYFWAESPFWRSWITRLTVLVPRFESYKRR